MSVRHTCAAACGMLLLLTGCGGQGTTSPTAASAGPASGAPGNVQPVVVSSGPADNTVNGLYTSVTLCVPGTSNCQTIDGVQVDTGSVGLRILASQLRLELPTASDGSGRALGNCAAFVDLSYAWGRVATADVAIAGEQAAAVPVQLIGGAGFPKAPSACSKGGTAADSAASLSANGLLGIGVFRQDCGPACSGAAASAPPVYFSCSGVQCSVTSVPLASQLQNPVGLFARDNNGFLLTLPSIPAGGAPTASGSLIFGVGTQANNALGEARVFVTDDVGDLSSTFEARTYSAYLDSGSNGLYFLDSATFRLPTCPGRDSAFACPAAPVSYAATITGQNGVSAAVSFSVDNAERLFRSGNSALSSLAGPDTGSFDWGLPFFFGRSIYVGIEGQPTPAGTGPYWAY